MNSALVGYGSSSDEEDEDSTNAAQDANNLKSSPLAKLSNGDHDVLPTAQDSMPSHEETVMPMVGPSMPIDFTATSEAYEENDPTDLPPLPERDLVRYLTQPSHPTTLLPSEPTASANASVTVKLQRFLKLKSQGVHFNEDLASKTSFKNPNLFASLLERSGLSSDAQYVSTLDPDLFSHGSLPSWAFKEALLETQQSIKADLDSVKKAQSAAGRKTIEFTSASQDSTPSSQKRKRN